MKIDTSLPILNLKNEPIKGDNNENFTIGQAFANILLDSKEGGKMKLFILAQEFFGSASAVNVDAADLALLKKAVADTTVYGTLVVGQLLVLLESLK